MTTLVQDLETLTGPVLRPPRHGAEAAARGLERAWRAGDLVRLAPSTFCRSDLWRAMPVWDRHRLTAVGVQASRAGRVVFTGLTAAHLHGLPVATLPADLEIRPRRPGHRGRRPTSSCFVAGAGRGPLAGLPRPPGLRCRTRGSWTAVAPPIRVQVRVSDGSSVGTVWVDAEETVIRSVADQQPLGEALAVLDAWAACGTGGLERVAAVAAQAAQDAPSAASRRRLARAFGHVEPSSESAGESLSRGILLDAGFRRPQVQREHWDADGLFIGRTDFWWEEVRVAGEFDGITKYDVALHPDETARRRAIRQEKEREVALLRVVDGLPRWTWEDLRHPQRLVRLLEQHGVPRQS